MPKTGKEIIKLDNAQKKSFDQIFSYNYKWLMSPLTNTDWYGYDKLSEYNNQFIGLSTNNENSVNNAIKGLKDYDNLLASKPTGSDKTMFELIADANGITYEEFAQTLKEFNETLDLGMDFSIFPMQELWPKKEEPIINDQVQNVNPQVEPVQNVNAPQENIPQQNNNIINEEHVILQPEVKHPVIVPPEAIDPEIKGDVGKYATASFRGHIQGNGTGPSEKIKGLTELNSYHRTADDLDFAKSFVKKAMTAEMLPIGEDGKVEKKGYDAAEVFFTNLGRNAFDSELEYTRSVEKTPNALAGAAFVRTNEISELLATGKAMANEEFVKKFNDGVDAFNANQKNVYDKIQKITPDLIDKWFKAGYDDQKARSKAPDKQHLIDNAKQITQKAMDDLGLTPEALQEEQQKRTDKFVESSRKTVKNKMWAATQAAKETNEIKAANERNQSKHSYTEEFIKDLKTHQQVIKEKNLPVNQAESYAKTCVEGIQDIEFPMASAHKPGHQDSPRYFVPMKQAAEELRGICAINNEKDPEVAYQKQIQAFDKLISKCDNYIKKNSWGSVLNKMFKSPEGNQRLEYARQLKATAQNMKQNYTEHALRDTYNKTLNEFAGKDYSKASPTSVYFDLKNLDYRKRCVQQYGGGLNAQQNDVSGVQTNITNKFINYIGAPASDINDQSITDKLYNGSTYKEPMNKLVKEEKGIREIDHDALAKKLGIKDNKPKAIQRSVGNGPKKDLQNDAQKQRHAMGPGGNH